MMKINKIYHEDVLIGLDLLDKKSVQCCVTSPPYYGLRDYKLPPTKWPLIAFSIFGISITVPEQECCLGFEKNPMDFVAHIVLIFRKVKDVMNDDGTLWLNFGDSYCGTSTGTGDQSSSTLQGGKKTQIEAGKRPDKSKLPNLKQKDLIGIPWMVAFALRDDGWYLRQDIIWNKPNPMPESVNDRCTKSHEYIFLFSKSKKYYFDSKAIATPLKNESIARLAQDIENQKGSERVPGKTNGTMKAVKSGKEWIPQMAGGGGGVKDHKGYFNANGELICGAFANKKSVWTVTTKPFKEAHFATFPEEIPLTCIKAGSPEGSLILDPFMGAATTALVARKLNRNFIGFELNPEYLKIGEKRLYKELGMFL